MSTARVAWLCCLGLLSANLAHAESMMTRDAGVPACTCDNDCVPHGLAVCSQNECFPSGFSGEGTPCPPCQAPLSECAGGCVDLSTNRSHCGECGNVCDSYWIGFECVASACTCSETVCDGHCIPTASDPDNCGGCGNQCDQYETCSDGACSCDTSSRNRALCDSECVNPLLDPNNCGSCGNVCASGHCESGSCRSQGSDLGPSSGRDAGSAAEKEEGCSVSGSPLGSWLPALLLLVVWRRPRARSAAGWQNPGGGH